MLELQQSLRFFYPNPILPPTTTTSILILSKLTMCWAKNLNFLDSPRVGGGKETPLGTIKHKPRVLGEST